MTMVKQNQVFRREVYFSADVETDGPIPGEFSILSFALVYAGAFDGYSFEPSHPTLSYFYRELKPISEKFEEEALKVNGLDRQKLSKTGENPYDAMRDASDWVLEKARGSIPILVGYPLCFDWSWLYWYFIKFHSKSPFGYSRGFDVKTAFSVKAGIPISEAGRSRLYPFLTSRHRHTHNALDDAIAQAEIFRKIFEWEGKNERSTGAESSDSPPIRRV